VVTTTSIPPADLFDLTGRTALITGAGSGLGRVMSLALAAAGARVVAVDIDYERAVRTADLVTAAGGVSVVHQCDVSDAAQVDELAGETADFPLSILINNAGISTRSRKVHEIPVQEWDRVLSVNLRSAFLCTRAFVVSMLSAVGPTIINMSSVVGSVALRPDLLSQASYAASKAAMIGLTRQTAADYGADGLRANAIAPGWLLGTALGQSAGNWSDRESQKTLLDRVREGSTLGRAGDASEIAGLSVYLASDAASFVTGQVFTIDGGWTTW
jgi:NAD(P)-dependent dehydrogenase (short-subunit alcohol dehydrogenase family)